MPKWKWIILGAATVLILFVGVASAHYVNSRWPSCSTTVAFNVPFNDTWKTAITNAMAAWNGVNSCVPLSIAGTGVTTSNDMMAVTDDTRSDVAWCTRTSSWNMFGPRKTTEADITYNIKYTYSSLPSQSGQWDIQSVVEHELGHAIGLDHNDDTPTCTSDATTWPTCATMGNNWGSGITHPRSLESHDEADKKGLY